MKIATYNVNSIRQRLPIVLDWISEHRPDVMCLQETKVQDQDFPAEAIEKAGYHATFRGMKGYNGVATLSRYIVNWDLRESMTEADIEIILQRAKEPYPEARPRIISDNGPQFIAKDFKEFIRISGMTHVRTSPYYPQSNGKIERWHKSLKGECIRPGTPLSLEDARLLVEGYVEHYNA